MFSKTFGYALRAVTYVVIHGNKSKHVGLKELSVELSIPHSFLGKIMQDLTRHGILSSVKGPSGGFYSNERTNQFLLIEILRITDGDLVFKSCALGMKKCDHNNPCPLHFDFAECRNGLLEVFSNKTIGNLAEEFRTLKLKPSPPLRHV